MIRVKLVTINKIAGTRLNTVINAKIWSVKATSRGESAWPTPNVKAGKGIVPDNSGALGGLRIAAEAIELQLRIRIASRKILIASFIPFLITPPSH